MSLFRVEAVISEDGWDYLIPLSHRVEVEVGGRVRFHVDCTFAFSTHQLHDSGLPRRRDQEQELQSTS